MTVAAYKVSRGFDWVEWLCTACVRRLRAVPGTEVRKLRDVDQPCDRCPPMRLVPSVPTATSDGSRLLNQRERARDAVLRDSGELFARARGGD